MLESSWTSPSRAVASATLQQPRLRGMTLVESLVVVAILAVLAALTAPAFSALLKKQRVDAVSYRLIAHLQTARSVAVSRNVRTTIAPVDGSHWEQGWQVFTDANRTSKYDGDDELIVAAPSIETGLSISGGASGQSWVSFAGDGQPKLFNGGFQAGSFVVCAGADLGTQVIMNRAGRIRLQPAGSACRHTA
jgi:type IV fimbrial biogenesis protein FimT